MGGPLLIASLLAALVSCSTHQSTAPTAGTPLHLRVLATHDFHGTLRPTTYAWSNERPVGGAAALKAMMDSLATACACPTVRLDGGDQMQGALESNLSFGAAVVSAFNHLGLDAAAVGNHELDWGVETLLVRQREARYPWLAANVFRVDNGERPEWARPFTILERGGIRLGVIGYATTFTPRTLRPEITKPYQFRSGYAAIRDALDAVWRRRPDFVVVVAHAGSDCGPKGCTGEMVDLAADLPPGLVHLIVGGHDHAPGDGVVNAIPIVRAGSHGRAVAAVDLYRRSNGIHAFTMAQHMVYADEGRDDARMAALLAGYFRDADAKGKEPVTTLAERLSASATGDRRLGTLLADVSRLIATADVGLYNPGGVRADLPRGAISYADLHRVTPFDDTIVRLTLTGHQLRQVVEQAGARYYYSNLRVSPLGFADNTPIRDDETYTLATNDYLAEGGDGLILLSTLPREALGVLLLDAVVQHLRTLPAPVTLPSPPSRYDD